MTTDRSNSTELHSATELTKLSHPPEPLAIVGIGCRFPGGAHPALVSGDVLGDPERKIVFVYTGMGPQWWGMGRELVKREPAFRAALSECDQRFAAHAGWSMLDALGNDQESSRFGEAQVAQRGMCRWPSSLVMNASPRCLRVRV